MSNARFDGIDARLDRIEAGINEIRNRMLANRDEEAQRLTAVETKVKHQRVHLYSMWTVMMSVIGTIISAWIGQKP